MPLGSFDRQHNLAQLTRGTFDVVVIGGGITGAGIALDAASRGLRTALIERDDFASGTSSKSSKMVHGGLRYLQNGDIRLVYEALRERQRLLRNAPHLVQPLPFLIPIFTGRDGILPRKVARALGLLMWGYDLTGGIRIGKAHKRLSKDKALAHIPTLDAERLAWAYLYYDAQADDARLTLALARSAALDHGATCVNHASVIELTTTGSGERTRVAGLRVEADGQQLDVAAHTVVNAAGVWSDDIRALDEGTHPHSIRPAKGIHITVPWHKVRNDIAAVIPVRSDKRSIFVVPWPGTDGQVGGPHGTTYVGTTDTDYDDDVDDPQCTPEDIDYLLGALNSSLNTDLRPEDVVGSWAGLRPLVRPQDGAGRTADLSRRHRVTESANGLISVTGGKLTTYREMAEDTVDTVARQLSDRGTRRLGRPTRGCQTARLKLRGADNWETVAERDLHLAHRYGSETAVLDAMIAADPELDRPLVPGLPYKQAEAVYAARYEMARTLDDVLSRRTRARLMARDATAAAAERTAELIGDELGWSQQRRDDEVAAYRASTEHERATPDLPPTPVTLET